MKKLFSSLFLIIFILHGVFADKQDDATLPRDYTFTIYPGTAKYFTMEQANEGYMSLSRMVNRGIDYTIGDKKLFNFIPAGELLKCAIPLFTSPVTHEEGHRSILTNQDIGSIAMPFFNSHGAAYVRGVTDDTLKQFRNDDYPSFIRMYTAGIESDYMMARRGERMAAFGEDSASVLWADFLTREFMVSQYMFLSVLYNISEKLDEDGEDSGKIFALKEEADEKKRDIVGMDTFGAVHFLFHPDAAYKRYIQWDDLNRQEKDFLVYRMGLRSLLNLVSPMTLAKPYFSIGEDMSITGSLGYCLAPFGDFIDENVYFTYRDVHLAAYIREYENKKHWFPAFGVSLCDFRPVDWLSISVDTHLWVQPKHLDFYTSQKSYGGAVKISTDIFLPFLSGSQKNMALNLSLLVKSAGFLPEVESHDELFRFTMGVTIRF